MQQAAWPELQVRSAAEPQRCPPQPEDWLGQSAAAQLHQAQMVMAWMSLPLQETVRRETVRQESRWLASPVRPVAVAGSYLEQLQMAAPWRSLAPSETEQAVSRCPVSRCPVSRV
jgi:hypothetical protein